VIVIDCTRSVPPPFSIILTRAPDNSFGNSLSFTIHNVFGTHALLEAVRSVGGAVRRVVHVSTDEVYGEQHADADSVRETGMLLPTNPYAATKASAEMICRAYTHSFQLPIIITRSNNVYGPAQFPEKIVPKFINQLMRGRAW
jgi:UDP-glucose 4,6-dehydratase